MTTPLDNFQLQSLMLLAYRQAQGSPDPSSQNGVVLVGSPGYTYVYAYNEFPPGILYVPENWERPRKYSIIEHAERNVIFKAASLGVATKGATMVCPWAACADCARAIVLSGVSTLVRDRRATEATIERWAESIAIAEDILKAGCVEIIELDGPFGSGGGDDWILRDGERFFF